MLGLRALCFPCLSPYRHSVYLVFHPHYTECALIFKTSPTANRNIYCHYAAKNVESKGENPSFRFIRCFDYDNTIPTVHYVSRFSNCNLFFLSLFTLSIWLCLSIYECSTFFHRFSLGFSRFHFHIVVFHLLNFFSLRAS